MQSMISITGPFLVCYKSNGSKLGWAFDNIEAPKRSCKAHLSMSFSSS